MTNEPKGHVHAELMAQYAEDARTHANVWELWEFRASGGPWRSVYSYHPSWDPNCEYRRKLVTKPFNPLDTFKTPEELEAYVQERIRLHLLDLADALVAK